MTQKTNVVFLACHILWVLLALLSIMEKGMNRITGHGDLLWLWSEVYGSFWRGLGFTSIAAAIFLFCFVPFFLPVKNFAVLLMHKAIHVAAPLQ